MGVVWLAQDEHLNEAAALKFLPPQVQEDREALVGLRRETARAHKLTHQNIIRIHDFHQPPNEPAFISMEFIEGKSLEELRWDQPDGVFQWDVVAPLVRQLCEALDYAHAEGVVHRDLKPANMLVDTKGRLKLADFGIAAIMSDSMSRATGRSDTSGTVPYMSPQQLTGKNAKPSDDVYALGASLYQLCTSKPPFCQGVIEYQILHQPPEPMAVRLADLEIKNDIPAHVVAVVMACLAKQAEERPVSAREVWERLEKTEGETQAEGKKQKAEGGEQKLGVGSQELEGNVSPASNPPAAPPTVAASPAEVIPATIPASQSEVIPVTIAAEQVQAIPATKPATRPELPPTVAASPSEADRLKPGLPTSEAGAVPVTIAAHTPERPTVSKHRWVLAAVVVLALLAVGGWYWNMHLPEQQRQEAKALDDVRRIANTKRLAEEQRLAEEKAEQARLARVQAEAKEEARKKADAEAKRVAEEQRLAEEKRKAEEAQKQKALAEQKTREEEAKRKAEEDARLKALAEQKAKEEAERRKLQPQLGARWTNSLGMAFAPVAGTKVLFGIWDVRVLDYAVYAAANPGVNASWKKVEDEGVPVSDGLEHPVTMVSWEDAKAFCAWLTKKEQGEGKLAVGQEYRLPTDAEWSYAVGIGDKEGNGTPGYKSGKLEGVYPWGTGWPPPKGAGNYADMTSHQKFGGFIEGYDDGYATTSPVGSFKANPYGLYDMGGNVAQWCEDYYNGQSGSRVLRGASWYLDGSSSLLSSFRDFRRPDCRGSTLGFRVVVVAAGPVR